MPGQQYPKTCNKCGSEIIMQKTPEGWKALNKDFTPHKCNSGSGQAAGPLPRIVARLNSYSTGSATLTIKGGKTKTYALNDRILRDWQAAGFLMPPENHPEVWLDFSIDKNGFVQPDYKVTQRPAWAGELTDPTGGEIKKPEFHRASELPKQETPCTSPGAAAAEPAKAEPLKKDEWSDEREEFYQLLKATGRDGIPELLKYLDDETDFYIAPSSTKYHDACDGGLLHHSLKAYHNLVKLCEIYALDLPDDGSSLAIIALLHDLCKVGIYKRERKSLPRRDERTGELVLDDWGKKIWDEQLAFTVDDQYPLGHGEKSVIMLQRFIRLTDTEIFAIRWHMMAYDDSRNSYAGNLAITNASDKFRIIPLFHAADLLASFLEMRPPEPPKEAAGGP